MINKTFRLLASIMLLITIGALAQSTPGSWTSVPTLGNQYTMVVETPARTFVLGRGALASISDSETFIYDRQNKLSDYNISLIRYNYDKGYLFIGYTNGNIDLLFDDDHVVNMPALKDASLSTSHEINNVDFGNDRIAVATKFGIVIFDDTNYEVVESGIYNIEVANALILGDRLMLYAGNKLYISPLSERHTQLSSFEHVTNSSGHAGMWDNIARINDNSFVRICSNPANTLYLYTIDSENKMTASKLADTQAKTFSFADGIVAVVNYWEQILIDSEGNKTKVSIPSALRGTASFSGGSTSSVWLTGNSGIAHYDFSTNPPTMLSDWYKPNASPVMRPADLVWSADGQKLYISHVGRSSVIPEQVSITMQVCAMDRDGQITDLSFNRRSSVRRLAVDPLDADVFYYGYGYNGFDVYNHQGLVKAVTPNEFLHGDPNYSMQTVNTFTFDPSNNLWTTNLSEKAVPCLSMLERRGNAPYDWTTITKTDWKVHPAKTTNQQVSWESKLLFSTHGPYMVMFSPTSGLMVINHNNTLTDFSDDIYCSHEQLVDQTGAEVNLARLTCGVEDRKGSFWFGSLFGVLVLDNPANGLEASCPLRRPLVARNDGTNYGDYLLSTDLIYCIAVDHTNRKWIGTENSGLYLVSEDGSEILEHFTSNNSPLPSNTIYAVSVDPLSSAVYIGTESGLYVYNGTSSPAADDYSEVNVYPNPVRPDYTGWITVTGLMDNSLVKIADSMGNVVYTGTSEGGTMVWDGCNSAGERVRSGVYFILASQNQNGTTGAVAKITVIN